MIIFVSMIVIFKLTGPLEMYITVAEYAQQILMLVTTSVKQNNIHPIKIITYKNCLMMIL